MANYIATDTDLTAVANAIRTKGGTSESLEFPSEFVAAIQNIPIGGGGVEYESGTFTPVQDIARPTISFANAHTTRPFFVLISDITNTNPTNGSSLFWAAISWYDIFGAVKGSNGENVYGSLRFGYGASNGYAGNGTNIKSASTGNNNTYMGYNMTESEFYPYTGQNTYYWRAGRTYKWIAVWAPTT